MFWHFIDRKNNPHWFIFCVLLLLLFVVLETIFPQQTEQADVQTNKWKTQGGFDDPNFRRIRLHDVYGAGEKIIAFRWWSTSFECVSLSIQFSHAVSSYVLWFARCTTASCRVVAFVFNFKAHICLFADRNIIPRRCNVKRSATKRCQVKQRAQTMQNKSICAWRKGKYHFSHKRESFVGHREIRMGWRSCHQFHLHSLWNAKMFYLICVFFFCCWYAYVRLCTCSYMRCRSTRRRRDEKEFGVIVWNSLLNMLAFILGFYSLERRISLLCKDMSVERNGKKWHNVLPFWWNSVLKYTCV